MVEGNYIIDKCENCGFISYNRIARCSQCDNMILTAEKIAKRDWIKGAVNEMLDKGRRKES